MGKFTGVLLASDFDDTLYNSHLEVSAENRAALEYFTREGGRFTVSTGRARCTFAPYVSLAPINAPVILANGAALYDFQAERTVCELPLPPSAAEDLTALLEAMPQVGAEVYHGDELYIQNPNEYTARHVRRVDRPWTECLLTQAPQPWTKAVLQTGHEELLKAQAYLRERWGERYETIFSNAVLLECTAKGATKGGMVLRLASLLGIRRENVYCVGDNENDIPMLAVSAIPFAPGDCAQTVKEFGAVLLPPCDDHAIARLVEILDGRY